VRVGSEVHFSLEILHQLLAFKHVLALFLLAYQPEASNLSWLRRVLSRVGSLSISVGILYCLCSSILLHCKELGYTTLVEKGNLTSFLWCRHS
jgi:hypothetical protein